MTYFLANEIFDPVIVQVNDFLFYRLRIGNLRLALDMSTGNFQNKESRSLGCKRNDTGICTSFITERCICLNTLSLGCLPY